jgi:hypothetical protein
MIEEILFLGMDLNVGEKKDNFSHTEIQEQVNKIAASGGFVGSEPLRGVLLYLSQHTLEYPGTTVKEYEIATQVLGRNTNFDSRIDSTVRAIASRLRSKLTEYYVREGQNDPILVDLPKGSYALSFSSRANALHTQPEHPTFDEPRSLPAPAPKPRGKWQGFAIAAVLVVGVGWLAYIAGRRAAASSSAVPASIKTFWGDFLQGGDPLIIFPNPTFRGLPETGMQLVEPDNARTDDTIDVFTGTGETIALELLTRQMVKLGHDSRAKRAHLFTWDDAANSNLIFIGGQVQNAAFAQLPKLQRFNLKSPAEEPFLHQGAVHDERPAPGGESYYLASRDFNNGNDYAVIALTSGISPQHQILILAGSNTYGTEGAAEFLTNAQLLQSLLDKLDVRAGSPIPPFEAIVRVQERGGAPISPQLVTVYKRQP